MVVHDNTYPFALGITGDDFFEFRNAPFDFILSNQEMNKCETSKVNK